MRFMRFALVLKLGLLPMIAKADVRLLMAEQDGCYYCALWNDEIAPIYPKTAEGKAIPLQRYEISSPPGDVTLARRVNFTPTFLLVKDNVEVARIEGYPGEHFFWGLLTQMLESADINIAPKG